MNKLTGIVFDMDDTLVFESDYVRSGFSSVANYCAECSTVYRRELYDFLVGNFKAGVRGKAFDLLFEKYPVLSQDTSIAALVEVYRTHLPQVGFAPGIHELIESLCQTGIRLGIISDGPLQSQSSKAAVLGVGSFFSPVLLTDSWGRESWKPAHRAFEEIEKLWQVMPQQCSGLVYIGDNPEKDFIAPNERGWLSVRLRLQEQLHFGDEAADKRCAPQFDLHSVSDLAAWLFERLP